MKFNIVKNTVLLFVLIMISCGSKAKNDSERIKLKSVAQNIKDELLVNHTKKKLSIVVGANRMDTYLPFLKGKRIGVVANQTSVIFKNDNNYTHIVDSLLTLNVDVKKVFAPEHGFRGKADAGEVVKDGIDTKTRLPVVSLYGKNKKPSKEQLENLDIVVFDIQDVGARFYTYISSLHYVMEACAEAGVLVVVLDRPNPNGYYVDGPILEIEHKSFVGMHPIPIVHGMTIGEYAKMINGEKWLANGIRCKLEIIAMANYNHRLNYSLPILPSPNLPNDQAIKLYPSLCFFEGTNVSAGRGTETQFQIFGSPFLNQKNFIFQFKPQPNIGSKYPKHQNVICYGKDLSKIETSNTLNLTWLIEAYNNTESKSKFFNSFFTKLAGTKKLQQQIEEGLSSDFIKLSWEKGIENFKVTRKKYLMYP